VDPGRLAGGRVDVAERLVALDDAAGGARDHRGAVVAGVVEPVVGDVHGRAAVELEPHAPAARDVVVRHLDVRGVDELDAPVLGAHDGETVHDDPGAPRDVHAIVAVPDQDL